MRVGVVGARGYVGAELLALLAGHPSARVEIATSGEAVGKRVVDVVPAFAPASSDLVFEANDPAIVAAKDLDGVFLGLPNDKSEPWVKALSDRSPRTVIVDLSADHRFDDAWTYGLPERNRAKIRGSRRIANPGCYATAAQLAIEPVKDLVDGFATVFGVSGSSGAGATPSPRNDAEALRDNILPYSLIGHVHERELRRALGVDVDFLPHVAPFFRGLSVTVSFRFNRGRSTRALLEAFRAAYEGERCVLVQEAIPVIREVALRHETRVGGFVATGDGRHAVVVAALDNLLGGAASQALRNMNLACGADECAGLF